VSFPAVGRRFNEADRAAPSSHSRSAITRLVLDELGRVRPARARLPLTPGMTLADAINSFKGLQVAFLAKKVDSSAVVPTIVTLADKARRELVEAKNQAESLLHSTKKSLAEHSDKVDPSTVEVIELAMSALEDTVKSEDAGKIKGGIQNLTDAAMKLGEAIYKASADATDGRDEDAPRDVDDDIVDADFEDLGNSKRK
jgi:hypothetical protein